MNIHNTSHAKNAIILLAYGEMAPHALMSLMGKFSVVSIITPSNEGREVLPVEEIALRNDIGVIQSNKLKDVESIVQKSKPQAVVICSYNKIIPSSVLVLATFINVHHGDLPRYRGRANMNWAIINGRNSIGLTIHEVVGNLDAGRVYKTYTIEISHEDTIKTVYDKVNQIIRRDLANIVQEVLEGYKGKKQRGKATYCCTRIPEDGYIDWNKSTEEIYNLIRGLTEPYPGAFTYFNGERMIVWSSEIPNDPRIYEGRISGRVVQIHKDHGVEVLTGDSSIIIKTVSYGGNKTSASEIIKSVRKSLGLNLAEVYEMLRKRR